MTCLCLTRNRRQWLPQAIRCYQTQTYPNRELLILADGADVRDLVPQDDFSIRLVHIGPPGTIGDKRNCGCEHAQGELIANWDDDDWSAPERLEQQVARLIASGKAVTGYHSMRNTDHSGNWWRYEGAPSYALGTSLLFRKDWWREHRFPSLQIGEDTDFAKAAYMVNQLISVDAGEVMYFSVHPGNTSPKNTEAYKRLAPQQAAAGVCQ